MGSNFAESDGDSAGLGRNHFPSSEIQSHTGFFLNLTFATPKPLKELAQGKSPKSRILQQRAAIRCREMALMARTQHDAGTPGRYLALAS